MAAWTADSRGGKGMLLCEHLIRTAGPVANVESVASSSLCSRGLVTSEALMWIIWSVKPWIRDIFPITVIMKMKVSRGVLAFFCQEGFLQNSIPGSMRWWQEEQDPQLKAPFAAHFCLMTLKHAKDEREPIVNFLCLMFFILS